MVLFLHSLSCSKQHVDVQPICQTCHSHDKIGVTGDSSHLTVEKWTPVIHISCVTHSAVTVTDSHYDQITSDELFSHRPPSTPRPN